MAQPLSPVDSALLDLLPAAADVCEAPSGALVRYNRAAARLWGREPGLGEGGERYSGALRLYRPDGSLLPHGEAPAAQVLRSGAALRAVRLVIERPDGSRVPVEIDVEPVRDAGGALTAALSMAREIAPADGGVAERYRALEAATGHVVWTTNAAGHVVDEQPGVLALTGQTLRDLAGTGWADAVHPEDRERALGAWAHAVATRSLYELECRVRTRDGSYAWVLTRAAPLLDAAGAVREWIGMAVDISEHRAREDRTELERRRFEMLFRIAVSLTQERDEQRLLQLITDEATAVTGASFGSFFFNAVGADGEKFMLHTLSGAPPEAFAGFRMPRATPLFSVTFRGAGPLRLDDVRADPRFGAWGPQPAGHLPVVSYLAVPVIARGGEVLGGLFFGHVEPARFTAEHERIALGIAGQAAIALESARLYSALRWSEANARKAYESALEADRRKDEFLAMLGHELRNPLAPIVTAIHLLRLRGQGGREVDAIDRQAQHLVRLVDDLLDVSRIERGRIELKRQPLELARVVAQSIEVVSPLLEQKRHHLTVAVPSSGLAVEADPQRLAQVVANLLTNAAKYTDPGGDVRVSAERKEAHIELRVEDSGIGISAAAMPRIFEKFVQGPRSLDRSQGGLGIGLTLVKALVELHGGSVEAHSAGPGQGSRFAVRLPAAAAAALDVQPPRPVPAPPAAPVPEGGRVLVVDDNLDAADTLADALRHAGYRVAVAIDGPTALELAGSFQPQIAILDIGLPVMDGYELARRLREVLPQPVRLIAVTGYGQTSDRGRALEAGFETHLVKPVDFSAVQSALAEGPTE